ATDRSRGSPERLPQGAARHLSLTARRAEDRQPAADCRSIFWSIAPKMLWPFASSISMRTLSPNDRNGVTGLPVSSVSTVRFSAKHDAPLLVSWLAMVPEPTMVPADSGRVFAAC